MIHPVERALMRSSGARYDVASVWDTANTRHRKYRQRPDKTDITRGTYVLKHPFSVILRRNCAVPTRRWRISLSLTRFSDARERVRERAEVGRAWNLCTARRQRTVRQDCSTAVGPGSDVVCGGVGADHPVVATDRPVTIPTTTARRMKGRVGVRFTRYVSRARYAS